VVNMPNQITDISIDLMIKSFIDNHKTNINKYAIKAYGNNSLSIAAFNALIERELTKAYYSFISNHHNDEYLERYLLSVISNIRKKIFYENKKNIYVCPGCKYFNNIEVLNHTSQKLTCNRCLNNDVNFPWEQLTINTFSSHSRRGYRCPDCERFIPFNNKTIIICPFPDCIFVGNVNKLRSMKHPLIKSTLELASEFNFKDVESSADTKSFINDETNNYINLIKECITTQISGLHYKCYNSTYINKLCMYKAFYNLVERYPSDMVSYLIHLNRNVKIQNKIFQEFVKLLESKIPFTYIKNEKTYEVKSLLDDNLGIFHGQTEFNSIVDQDNDIPNSINELYVGGRKGKYCRPYYIGKLIDVINLNNNQSIINNVMEYSFIKITMDKCISPKTPVNVKLISHSPHYQMGGMVYLNRIRRELVDRIYFLLNGKKRLINNKL
jgi:hypothetical protein